MLDLSKYGFTIVQIETKATCNMGCQFCPYPIKKDKESVLEDKSIYKLIDDISRSKTSIDYITFSQFNEPLLDGRRVFDYISYAKKNGLKTLMITNALLLNKQRNIDRIIDSGVDYVKLSLQTLDEKTFSTVRGVDYDFNKYSKSINTFLSKVVNTNIDVTIDLAYNFNNDKPKFIKNVYKILGLVMDEPSVPSSKEEVYGHTLNLLLDWSNNNYPFHPNVGQNELRDQIFNSTRFYVGDTSIQLADNINIKIKPFHYGLKLSEYYPVQNFSCHTEIISVLASGDVVPCCLDYDGELSMGNIHNTDFDKILSRSKDFIDAIRSPDGEKNIVCQRCFGAPTRRGAAIKSIYNKFSSQTKDNRYLRGNLSNSSSLEEVE